MPLQPLLYFHPNCCRLEVRIKCFGTHPEVQAGHIYLFGQTHEPDLEQDRGGISSFRVQVAYISVLDPGTIDSGSAHVVGAESGTALSGRMLASMLQ